MIHGHGFLIMEQNRGIDEGLGSLMSTLDGAMVSLVFTVAYSA